MAKFNTTSVGSKDVILEKKHNDTIVLLNRFASEIEAAIADRVVGPASATSGYIALWDGTTGKLLKNSTYDPATLVVGPASATDSRIPLWNGTTGKLLKDSSYDPATLVVGPASAVSGNLASYNGTTGKLLQDAGIAYVTNAFTPALRGSGTAGSWTWTTQEGIYTKIGNIVFVSIRLVPNVISGSPTGTLQLTGLPFTTAASPGGQHMHVFASGVSWGTSATVLELALTPSATTGLFYGQFNNGAYVACAVGNIVSGDDVRITGFYFV